MVIACVDVKIGSGTNRVDRKRAALFERRGYAGRRHHDTVTGAFAVPAPLTMRSPRFPNERCRQAGSRAASVPKIPRSWGVLQPPPNATRR